MSTPQNGAGDDDIIDLLGPTVGDHSSGVAEVVTGSGYSGDDDEIVRLVAPQPPVPSDDQ